MRTFLALTRAAIWVGEAVAALLTAYLGLLTLASWVAPRATVLGRAEPRHRFLILVPAHDEEGNLPRLMDSLRQIDYPPSMYSIHVIADNCTDGTAALARAAGAVVHERFDTRDIGKGYALRWALGRIWSSAAPHDAVLILDADTVVSANVLRVGDARLARGERVVQVYYAVQDPDQAWSVGLRSAALAAVHYLRPKGRSALGGSAGLKGNGMIIASDVLKRYLWPASLTEDIEYHSELILNGERVTFAPDATVWAEMPDTLNGSRTQNVRWERGRLQMARRFLLPLLREAWSRRSPMLFHAAMEQAIPPLSVLVGGSILALLGSAALDLLSARHCLTANGRRGTVSPQTAIGVGLIVGQAVYVLSALLMTRAPLRVYRSLLYAPAYAMWKCWLYARVLLRLDQQGWVRTERNATRSAATGGQHERNHQPSYSAR